MSTGPRRHDATFDAAIACHDAEVAARGLDLWFGAEPTFTDRLRFDAEWKTAALGADKHRRGRRLAAALARAIPGSVLLRSRGRQYPGEPVPRWSVGVYARRDGTPLWDGPPDPLCSGGAGAVTPPDPEALREALREGLCSAGLCVQVIDVAAPLGARLLACAHPERLAQGDWEADPRVVRRPLADLEIPPEGGGDGLAGLGIQLFCLGVTQSPFAEDLGVLELELPTFPGVREFQGFLALLQCAVCTAGVPALILSGYPPPVDEAVAWTTVTPDPGVVEVNMAPCTSAASFLAGQRRIHALAAGLDLTPYQLLYNGELADSGGGQHLTFGGPRPEGSPFFLHPHLLPRLVAYANRHPSLSYWFAVRAVGSCGQQPRADEGSPEVVDGLAVALNSLEQPRNLSPEVLWSSLAPFLADRFGNPHRSEINVEKLWNPSLGERGRLGLVELRAFRMTRSPERAVAVAVLCRSLLALLADAEQPSLSLKTWGPELHDRFALPFYLQQDLKQVLDELRAAGLGLGDALEAELLDDGHVLTDRRTLGGETLQVRQATEFWPVVGSGSAREDTYRLMDSSTARLELLLCASGPESRDPGAWRLLVDGFEVPWVAERYGDRGVLLRGLRYKAFQPAVPVFPLVPVRDPLEVTLVAPGGESAYRLRVYGWQPDGQAYPGLPPDHAEARRRAAERLRLESVPVPAPGPPVPVAALSPCCLDLRRLPDSLHYPAGVVFSREPA